MPKNTLLLSIYAFSPPHLPPYIPPFLAIPLGFPREYPLEFPPNGELVSGLPQLGGGVEGEVGSEQVVHGA
jgi:hypothetical protein